MSSFAENLSHIVSNDPPVVAQVFGQDLDTQWVEKACLKATHLTIRRRKFPSDVVMWLVIAMALWRDMAVVDVARRLGIAQTERKDGKRSVFCAAMAWMVAPSKIPALLERLDEALIEEVLPARRNRPAQPRAVKGRKKMYPIKRNSGTDEAKGGRFIT